MFKFVIFDLDGTILNTLDDLADAGNYALSELGLPTHETEKYKYFVGNGIPKLIKRILPNNADKDIIEKTLSLFSSYYGTHMNNKTKPYDGIIEMLSELKSKGVSTAVVTNKSHEFALKIIPFYFGDLIDVIYGSLEDFPKKPNPYWVNKAISDLGFSKSDVLYIGDSGVDMETAKNAGVVSCGVLWGFRTKEELLTNGASYICADCNDILGIVLND